MDGKRGILGKKRFIQKKLDRNTTGSSARKTRAAEQNRGSTERTEAWIPTLSKEQPDTKAREARRQPG